MNSTFSLLIVFLTQLFMPRHNAQLRLLKAQIQILRARIPTQRIILSPEEKAELLRIAEAAHDGFAPGTLDARLAPSVSSMQHSRKTRHGSSLKATFLTLHLFKLKVNAAWNGRPSRCAMNTDT